MKLLFATGAAYPPDGLGGAEISCDQLARALVARGHDCAAIAVAGTRLGRLARRLHPRLEEDRAHPYPLLRTAGLSRSRVRLEERLRRDAPDVVVCSNTEDLRVPRVAARAARVLVWVHDTLFGRTIDWLPPDAVVAACSRFIARELRHRVGVTAQVLHPYIDREACRARRRRPERVTLMSAHRHKGVELFLAVAALLPHRRFAVVESTRLPVRPTPNVTLVPPTADPRQVYARASLLLVPSAQEAFGRVIVEAQVNGIPVLARDAGGAAEALGDGGVLLPPEAPPGVWAERVEALLADPAQAASLGERGRAAAARPDLAPGAIVDRFLDLCA
jgi:glycosyltransferase involved in cell wall biosynthesis